MAPCTWQPWKLENFTTVRTKTLLGHDYTHTPHTHTTHTHTHTHTHTTHTHHTHTHTHTHTRTPRRMFVEKVEFVFW